MDLDQRIPQGKLIGLLPHEETVGTGFAPESSSSASRRLRVRWLMWSILALCYLIVYFQRIAPGVVADRLMADFAVGGGAVGLLTAIYLYVYAAMQIPAGVLADTLGVRRTATMGASLTGLGSLIFGLTPSLELSYVGRFLIGLGVSVIFVAALKFQSNWFRPSEFGTVSGLLMLIGSFGAVVATTPMAVMAQWLGWRLSFVGIGVVSAALGFAAWRWVRERPADLGLPTPHDVGPSHQGAHPISLPAKRTSFFEEATIVWRNRQTWAGLMAHFGLFGAYLTLNGLWGVPYLMHVYGMDRVEAANHLLVASVGLLVSAPLAGTISDRLRRRKLPTIALASLAAAVWITIDLCGGKPPTWALYPLFAALGFAGGNVTLILTLVKEANPPRLSGLAMGTANNAFLCAAVLQPAVGYLLDGYWQGVMQEGARVYPVTGYQVAMAVMTAFVLLGWLGTMLLRETHCRNQAET